MFRAEPVQYLILPNGTFLWPHRLEQESTSGLVGEDHQIEFFTSHRCQA